MCVTTFYSNYKKFIKTKVAKIGFCSWYIPRVHNNRRLVCNSVKFETGQNLLPVLKLVTLLHMLRRHKPLLLST